MYNALVMKTNLEDFVRSVYNAGYYMRAYDKGVPCGEVSIVSAGLVYDNYYGSEELLFKSKDFNDCEVEFSSKGNVKITVAGEVEYFNISKDISKEDFEGFFSKNS